MTDLTDRLMFFVRWCWHTARAWWFCDRHGLECDPDGYDPDGHSRCERCGCPLVAVDVAGERS